MRKKTQIDFNPTLTRNWTQREEGAKGQKHPLLAKGVYGCVRVYGLQLDPYNS